MLAQSSLSFRLKRIDLASLLGEERLAGVCEGDRLLGYPPHFTMCLWRLKGPMCRYAEVSVPIHLMVFILVNHTTEV